MSKAEQAMEDAAKAAFVKAQSVYRADHDHFPLRHTWETTLESVREGWRAIAYAALEAAQMPPLGTQPEPRQPRQFNAESEELRRLREAVEYAHANGFEWPSDPLASGQEWQCPKCEIPFTHSGTPKFCPYCRGTDGLRRGPPCEV